MKTNFPILAVKPMLLVRCPAFCFLKSKCVTYRGGSHVFATVWDFRLVGVVGTANHWTRGRQAAAPHHAAASLARRHPSLPQFPVARAGRAPLGVHDGHGGPAFVVEDSRAQTHRNSYKEYSVDDWVKAELSQRCLQT